MVRITHRGMSSNVRLIVQWLVAWAVVAIAGQTVRAAEDALGMAADVETAQGREGGHAWISLSAGNRWLVDAELVADQRAAPPLPDGNVPLGKAGPRPDPQRTPSSGMSAAVDPRLRSGVPLPAAVADVAAPPTLLTRTGLNRLSDHYRVYKEYNKIPITVGAWHWWHVNNGGPYPDGYGIPGLKGTYYYYVQAEPSIDLQGGGGVSGGRLC